SGAPRPQPIGGHAAGVAPPATLSSMEQGRMVRLATVQSGFEAKVLAARLGAEGIVWELRGAVDGPYPMGPVVVLVEEHELAVARELLLVDGVESSSDDVAAHLERPPILVWLAIAAVVVVATSTLLRVLVVT